MKRIFFITSIILVWFQILAAQQSSGKTFPLKVPNETYVATFADGSSLATDKKDDTSLLTAVPNPTPVVK